MLSRSRQFLGVLLLFLFLPSLTHAQAWVPAPGRGTLSLNYQYLDVQDHLFSSDVLDGTAGRCGETFRGDRVFLGNISSQTLLLDADFGVTRRLAVSANVAYISSKYDGPCSENEIDDGNFHGTFQDVDIGARYMVLRSPFALTPFVGAVIPTHDYETLGHSSVGRNLNEFRVGVSVGRDLGPFLTEGFVQVTYSRSFVENVQGFGLDRDNFNAEVGYFFTPRFSVWGLGRYANTHDGIDWFTDLRFAPSGDKAENRPVHDRAAEAEYTRLGGGLAYTLLSDMTVHAVLIRTVSGDNTHSGTAFSLGTSWGFSALFSR